VNVCGEGVEYCGRNTEPGAPYEPMDYELRPSAIRCPRRPRKPKRPILITHEDRDLSKHSRNPTRINIVHMDEFREKIQYPRIEREARPAYSAELQRL